VLVRKLPSGIVTLLFTDIESSTRLLHELGERYPEVLAEHRRVLRDAFSRHGGVEVDTQGDAFFVAFTRASGAVAAAGEARDALADGPVRVRIGIHTGEPVVTEEGYVGVDVHRAARIAAAGHGGQVVLSQATRALLDAELPLRDLGEHRLKDLVEPEWLSQLGYEDFPPLRSLNNTNLPAAANPLVGRQRELRELSGLLHGQDVRLVTLTGAGGTGKTRLALEAAAEAVGDYPNGVFFVSLAPISDASLVLPTIAQTLGLKEPPGEQLLETLARDLEPKRILLFLDNFEQVVDAASALAKVLERAPALKLLVTSREPLHLAAEREYAVLPLPDADAIALFRARAADAEPIEAVAEICRLLDGLPLALELAAARTKVLPPRKLLDRLGQRLPLLSAKRRDLPERQQTLGATIAWSYDLLSPEEQQLFSRLSVFVGGCTLEAAEEVSDAKLETLESLVDKSLLRQSHERFSMLETIREFAAERLQESREIGAVRCCHAQHFLALAESAAGALRGRDQAPWVTALERETENIRSALRWSVDNGAFEPALRFGIALWAHWLTRGQSGHERALLDKALALGDEAPDALRAWALLASSELARFAGEFDASIPLKEGALALFRTVPAAERRTPGWVGDPVPDTLDDMAVMATAQGRWEDAKELLDEALALRHELGERFKTAHTLAAIAFYHQARREWPAAAAALEDALDRLRADPDVDPWWIVSGLQGHAYVLREQGRADKAFEVLVEAAEIVLTIGGGDLYAAAILEVFAGVALDRHEPERAARMLRAAEAVSEAAGIPLEDQAYHERLLADVRAELNAQRFAEAWEAGGAMNSETALEYALQGNTQSVRSS
jgi:predicted ATPase